MTTLFRRGMAALLIFVLISVAAVGCIFASDHESTNTLVTAKRGDLELPPDPLKPTEPTKPTEPKPTEPKPTEPKPTEPKPTEPTEPTEPTKPTEPDSPTEPDPVKPCDGGKDCPSAKFSDLDTRQWYHAGVDYALTNGLMNGMGGGKFEPDGALTRAMLVTVLYRAAGQPSVAGKTNPFKDVASGTWYTAPVIWAASNGIVKGMSATEFAPDANITREQIATILYRYDGELNVSSELPFPDAGTVSDYAVKPMQWAVSEGIINGKDGKLAPQDNATRAQVAKILYCYFTR